MSAEATAEKPFHLQGNFAPVDEEIHVADLPVEGALPPELTGLYARQAPNPVTGVSAHWFMGQGMVHGIRLEAGRAAWFRNRYVLDDQLETVGWSDYDGKLTSAFSAHPKICPVTGEMISFGYGQLPPYLVYLRVSPDGKLVQSEEISVGGPTMMHDFAISEKHALFLDLPVVFSLEDALKGSMPFAWSDDYPARIGVMPRTGGDADVRWFDVNPCFIFHTLNAWDEGNTVVLDACHNTEVWRKAGEMQGDGKLSLRRFTFDLATGNVKEETLDDRPMEFPRVADARIGQKNRFGFTLRLDPNDAGDPDFVGILKTDFQTGKSELHEYGEGMNSAEAVFVPAEGADPDSDEGYVMSYVHDEKAMETSFVVLDATDMRKDPIARVKLPQRVPYGFHGSWMPDER